MDVDAAQRSQGTQESVGLNRIGVGKERVLQRRFSQSLNLSMRRNFNRENREIPEISASASNHAIVERSENAYGGTADMHVSGKSTEYVD